ncbi:hypothetical protein J6590_107615 [Homalodisca vitripennis]|nr:hypothetical protein J6590_107615 [Homalodisca vitripennis]
MRENTLDLQRLLKARSEHKNEVRKFVIPKLNKAEDYINIINWADVTIIEPPMTKHFLMPVILPLITTYRVRQNDLTVFATVL